MVDENIDDLHMSRARRSRIDVRSGISDTGLDDFSNTRMDQIIETHLIPNEAQAKIETLVDNNYPSNDDIAVWLQTPSNSTEESVIVSSERSDIFKELMNELPNSVQVTIDTQDDEYTGQVEVYVKQIDTDS